MSRHILSRKRGRGYIVVGYDRPLKHFFVQVWSSRGNHLDTFKVSEVDAVRESIEYLCGPAPEGLLPQLTSEEAGTADTNTCKDWRAA